MDEGRTVDIIFLDVSKAFDIVQHKTLREKTLKYGLDGQWGGSEISWTARPRELWSVAQSLVGGQQWSEHSRGP